jgi:hypothetical protein
MIFPDGDEPLSHRDESHGIKTASLGFSRTSLATGGSMTIKQLGLVFAVLTALVGVAYVSQDNVSVGVQMTDAAAKLHDSFTPEQKTKADFAFEDKERTSWFFTPQQKNGKALRKGLPLEEMTKDQKAFALALLRSGTSPEGYTKAATIMSLEAILSELEKGGPIVRNPEWYFFTFFGTPARTGKWGWRVEGHHLSLNFTVENGAIIAATPAFFGANPATVKAGPRQGLRTLGEAEDFAQELFASLDKEQRGVAFRPKQFAEIEEAKPAPNLGEPLGLAAGQMTESQRRVLWKLIEAYATRMPPEVAQHQLREVKQAGLDKVHFAFAQDDKKPGKPYSYRVHGSTFVIEFLNVQADSARNPANHIHSAWRNLKGDFGIVRN